MASYLSKIHDVVIYRYNSNTTFRCPKEDVSTILATTWTNRRFVRYSLFFRKYFIDSTYSTPHLH